MEQQNVQVMQKRQRPGKLVWKRLKKSKTAMFGLVIIVLLVLMAIFADFVAPYSYKEQNFEDRF